MNRLFRLCLLAVVATVVTSAPCAPTATTKAPCVPRTTKAPCVPRTTTTTTTTTTTNPPAPCVTTTVAAAEPCETTTTAYNPCQTTTAAFNPCETTTTTTTPSPCETTTVAANPCEATTVTQTLPPVYYPVRDNRKDAKKEAVKDGINWKPYDAKRLENKEKIQVDPPIHTFGDVVCRDGWTRFQESCYYVERDEKKTMRKAQEHCREINSTLFVPNTAEEFRTIFENAPVNTWTWLGLRKENEQEPAHWHVRDALNFTKLNWLNGNPYGDGINGWTSVSQCAAHWNPFTSLGKYTFFYPCIYQFHYVCERNSTLATQINDLF